MPLQQRLIEPLHICRDILTPELLARNPVLYRTQLEYVANGRPLVFILKFAKFSKSFYPSRSTSSRLSSERNQTIIESRLPCRRHF